MRAWSGILVGALLLACGGAGDDEPIEPCPEPESPDASQVMVTVEGGVPDFVVVDAGIYWAEVADGVARLRFLEFDHCTQPQTLLETPGLLVRVGVDDSHVVWSVSDLGYENAVFEHKQGSPELTEHFCGLQECNLEGVARADGRIYWRRRHDLGWIDAAGDYEVLHTDETGCTHPPLVSDGTTAYTYVGVGPDDCRVVSLPELSRLGDPYFVYDLDVTDEYLYWTTPYGLYEAEKDGAPDPRFVEFYPSEARSLAIDADWFYAADFSYGYGADLVAVPRDGTGSTTLDENVLDRLPGGECIFSCTDSVEAHGGYVYYWKAEGERTVLYRRRAPV